MISTPPVNPNPLPLMNSNPLPNGASFLDPNQLPAELEIAEGDKSLVYGDINSIRGAAGAWEPLNKPPSRRCSTAEWLIKPGPILILKL
jgi:hypothetical protein